MVHFFECSTAVANYNIETQIEMRDMTVEHLPGDDAARVKLSASGQVLRLPPFRRGRRKVQQPCIAVGGAA